MKIVVTEGVPFELAATDRAALLDLRIPGFVQAHHGGRISISRLVGHIRLPTGTLLHVRSSKSPAASVLAWMAYLDATLRSHVLITDVPNGSDDGDVAVLTARLFLSELRRAVGRYGVPREYASTTTTSSSIRGRIDFRRLMDRAGDMSKVPCSVWERHPQSALVRTLAAAVDVVGRDHVMRHASHGDLSYLRAAFAAVAPQVDIDLLAGKSPLPRNEAGFGTALAIARLLLRRRLLGEGVSDVGVGYLVNLEALFEATVVRALQRVEPQFRAKVPVDYEKLFGPKTAASAMRMEMDVFAPGFATHGGIVVDAKYKRAITAANLQQVVTYCYVTGSSRAVLVVPAGFDAGPATYRFKDGRRPEGIDVHVVELDTSGASVEAWEQNTAAFAERLRLSVGAGVAA